MYLDLKPVLSGETRKITFALPLDADAVGEIKKLFPDITDVSSADISGEVCNMSGYMVLRENALIKFSALCARCAETANSELSLSFDASRQEMSQRTTTITFFRRIRSSI